ncbi:MAG TPA: inosine/xanthosine triphosphatase [Verrucomicrobiae bacterium]|nr:inosine/xanthosine triphosphatase [Verrucomicrobiae bacterium]
MDRVLVIVGSRRRPKLDAVSEALSSFSESIFPAGSYEVIGEEAESGVRHTPLSREEIMRGAKNRAEELAQRSRQAPIRPGFFVGLEGGLNAVEQSGRRWVFLEGWAYVTDGRRGAFGQSGAVLLPETLVRRVVDEGEELGRAIDDFAGGRGIRDAQGAWGVLTGNRITRQEAFRVAVVNAFAPFYNPAAYDAERGAAKG